MNMYLHTVWWIETVQYHKYFLFSGFSFLFLDLRTNLPVDERKGKKGLPHTGNRRWLPDTSQSILTTFLESRERVKAQLKRLNSRFKSERNRLPFSPPSISTFVGLHRKIEKNGGVLRRRLSFLFLFLGRESQGR